MTAFCRCLVAMLLVLMGAAFGQTTWISTARVGNEARFLFNSSVQRYDLVQKIWLPAYPLSVGSVTSVAADASGSVVASGSTIYRGAADFTALNPLANTTTPIQSVFLDGNLVIAVHSTDSAGHITIFDRNTGTQLSTQPATSVSSYSAILGPQTNRVFGQNHQFASPEIVASTYSNAGVVGYPLDHTGTSIFSFSRIWLFPDETKVVDDTGTIYGASSLKYLGNFAGTVKDIDFNGSSAVVLRGALLVSFDSTLLETGRASVGVSTGAALFVNGGEAFVFSPGGVVPGVNVVPLSSFKATIPGNPVDAAGLTYTPDSIFPAANGDLVLFSKAQKSLFRWSPASRQYTRSIPLLGTPSFATYSSEDDAAYLAYPGKEVNKVNFAASQPAEFRLTVSPNVPNGMAMAGNFPVISANPPNSSGQSHHIFDRDGKLLISRNTTSGVLIASAWDSVKRKLYFFETSSLENEMIDQTGTVITTGSISFSKEGRPAPIRLNADGSKVLLGNGAIYTTTVNATLLATLPNTIVDAVWTGDKVVTVSNNNSSTDVTIWTGPQYLQQPLFRNLNGTPLSVSAYGSSYVATTLVGGVPRFTLLDSGLNVQYISPNKPISPSGLTVTTRTPASIGLQWQDLSDNETGFQVEYRQSGGSWLTGPAVGANVVTAEVTGLNPGTTYEFRVSAVADSLVSNPSPVVTTSTFVSPDQPAGEPYQLTAARIFATQVTLTWNDNATNETGFRIYRSTTPSTLGTSVLVPANTTTFVDADVVANVTYYYHIQSVNGGLSGDLSALLQVRTTAGNIAPAKPGSVVATSPQPGVVTVTWADLSSNEDQFIIQRTKVYFGDGIWTEVGRVDYNVTSFSDTTAVPTVTYTYRVIAVNSYGSSAGVQSGSVVSDKFGGEYAGLASHNSTLYCFAFQKPNRIECYDMVSGQWRAPLSLSAAPGALWVDEDGIFVADGKDVVRFDLDGSDRKTLATAGSTITTMFTLGRVLGYGVPIYATGTYLTTIDKTTGQALSNFGSADDSRVYTAAPSLNRLYARSYGYSPGNMAYMEIDQSGKLVKTGRDFYGGDYYPGQRTFVFPNGARVADDSGNVYSTDSLTHVNTFGTGFTDLAFYGSDVPIVLVNDKVYAYSNSFLQRGSAPAGVTGLRVAVQGSNALVFAEDFSSVHGIQIKTIPLSDLSAPQPGEPIDPKGLVFTPDDAFLDENNNVLLFSKSQGALFRWSPADGGYTGSFTLAGAPDYAAYSKENRAAYFEYGIQVVRKLDLTAAEPKETSFFNLFDVPRGITTAGGYVVAADMAGAWNTHYVLRPDGTLASSAEWKTFSGSYAWDPVKRRLYYFSDDTSPNDLLYEVIDADGQIKESGETPYHGDFIVGGPIRVSPDGSKVAIGAGSVFETGGLTLIKNLAGGFKDAVWRESGLLTIQSSGSGGTEIRPWDPVTMEPLAPVADVPGTPLRIFGLPADRAVVMTLDRGMPRFYVLNAAGAVEFDYIPDAPHIVGTPPAATEDIPFSWQPQIELPAGGTATATLTAPVLPSWLQLVGNALVGTPSEADSGDPLTPQVLHEVVLELTDSLGRTARRTFQIPVLWVNDSPTLPASFPALVANEHGDPVELDAGASMHDPDRNDPHTWTITGNTRPEIFASLAIDTAGKLTATFAPYVSGSAAITLRVTDSFGAFADASVVITLPDLPEPSVSAASQIVLNRLTGLYEQTLTVTNTAGRAIGGFDLLISGLRDGVQLYNGTSTTPGEGGIAYHQPVAAGASVQMVIQYYAAIRGAILPPAIVASTALPEVAAEASDQATFAINRMIRNGDSVVLEFTAQAGKTYQVQYSDDFVHWKSCPYPLRAGGSKVQWIDRGPPGTDVSPATLPRRFYRIQSLEE